MEGNAFDVIYIDGSHYAADVLSDAVLSFPLLKSGGIMIFDDYQWRPYSEEWKMPRAAINGFCASYENKTEIIHVGYQLILKKL
jgi:predicted O-methyltransferase YrrM